MGLIDLIVCVVVISAAQTNSASPNTSLFMVPRCQIIRGLTALRHLSLTDGR
jgi:hypothetical protein